MKRVLIETGHGVVLSDAIAAILHGHTTDTDATPSAVIVLRGGAHLSTKRAFADLASEVEAAVTISPLADFVPEIAQAMELLRTQMSQGGDFFGKESDTGKPANTGAGGGSPFQDGAAGSIAGGQGNA